MDIHKLLNALRRSGKSTDLATLQFPNKWGVRITPTTTEPENNWDVVVLHDGKAHYDNDIALGNVLTGQSDEDVADICQRIKQLESDVEGRNIAEMHEDNG